MVDPHDELADADVITSGGEDFGAFAASRWPGLLRLAYELTGDQSAATDLACTALARTRLAWWRVSRTGDPDAHARRILTQAGRRARRRSAGTQPASQPAFQPRPLVRLDQIEYQAKRIRWRRARIVVLPVLAGIVAAAAWLVPESPSPARPRCRKSP